MNTSSNLSQDVANIIRNIPDFPKEGIQFKDITPLLQNPELLERVVSYFADIYKDKDIKVIRHIKSLLYDKKYTIKGAKQYMLDHYSNEQNITKVLKISNNTDEKLLIDLKAKLQESLDLINKLKS